MNGRHHGNQGRSHAGGSQPPLGKITAPYNFVPLSRKVFFPDWAGEVSHDIPFDDGISGELVCELVTDTPVYVRNGGKWDHDAVMGNPEAQSFFYVKNGNRRQFMIPGTTLKGMLRNVIEIASFGKMNRVDDHRYGVRDLTNPNKALYVNHMTEKVGNDHYKARAKAAWLVASGEGEEWELIPCRFARVEQNDLIASHPQKPAGIKKRVNAVRKYELWGNDLSISFSHDGEKDHPHSCGKLRYIRARNIGKGTARGTLVFTGQPAENKRDVDPKSRSKHMEFIFFDENPSRIPVPPTVKKEFQFIHSDANEVPNEEWMYWKAKLEKGKRVPVFYLTNPDGSLHSLGLAMMYRLPYANSVRQAIEHTSKDHFAQRPDLAETIFGYVDGSNPALKGRVALSPAVATHAEPADPIRTVLGAPKPSFYPNYIEQQTPVNQYKTFMDSDCRIRGWKRYPVRQADDVRIPPGVSEKVDTKLIPLQAGARFTFRVKLHNLKPVELGAIAWALTWGNDPKLRHSLGMGKAMGFGVARISIVSADVQWQEAMTLFEQLMDREVGGGWRTTAQMEQLLSMANPSVKPQCGALKHLSLAPGAGNEFVKAKREKLALLPHVRPVAKSDADRFKGLSERQVSRNPAPVTVSASTEPAAESQEVTWPVAQLGFNPGSRLLTAKSPAGSAELKLEGDAAGLVDAEIMARLRKGKIVTAEVVVEPAGGGRYRIVRLQFPD